jgi:hypothetical protein
MGCFLKSNVKENCTQYKSGEFQTGGGQNDAVALGGVMLTVTEFGRKNSNPA